MCLIDQALELKTIVFRAGSCLGLESLSEELDRFGCLGACRWCVLSVHEKLELFFLGVLEGSDQVQALSLVQLSQMLRQFDSESGCIVASIDRDSLDSELLGKCLYVVCEPASQRYRLYVIRCTEHDAKSVCRAHWTMR